jgi:ABC-type hemin transport system substrate-binding protein
MARLHGEARPNVVPNSLKSLAPMRQFPPRRIVCLTEETVETLYLLGEQDRIVGVSGCAVRPPQVRTWWFLPEACAWR